MRKKAFVVALTFSLLLSVMMVAVGGEATNRGEDKSTDFEVEIINLWRIDEESDEVREGNNVHVQYRVFNSGEVKGSEEIVFKVDGEVEEVHEPTLEPQEEMTRMGFVWPVEEAGEHELEVVCEGGDTDTKTVTVEEVDESSQESSIWLATAILLTIIFVGLLFVKRTTSRV